MTTTIQLSKQQNECVNSIIQWQYEGYQGDVFNVHGYAGTGKSTVLAFLRTRVFKHIKVLYVAYTGKAVERMINLGCPSADTMTIHSAFKRPETNIENGIETTEFVPISPEDFGDKINDTQNIFNVDLVVLDESSMVDDTLAQDMMEYGVPILSFGDLFQLPPVTVVKEKTSIFTRQTDFMLDEVHRQALDSGIIRVATMIRSGDWAGLRAFEGTDDVSIYWTDRKQFLKFPDFGQPICHSNFFRYDLTKAIKNAEHFTPSVGDSVMCVKNNRKSGLFNGLSMKIKRIISIDEDEIRFVCDDDKIRKSDMVYFKMYNLKLNRQEVAKYVTDARNLQARYSDYFDYAFVLTVHKAQGSEYQTVTVFDDNFTSPNPDYARWLYTAVTRAKNKLNLMMSASQFRQRFKV